ncbi:hypothetical protein L6164_027120 [Bauhinia variegata]|uniref:Uncharacterized protein n=1 Tax=Bauhinia variegata TaxID=167791 RepID=A0ACB9LS95_BAUVA|nr:hypothetical protein L6164_027120 [Bauhinia variegata]
MNSKNRKNRERKWGVCVFVTFVFLLIQSNLWLILTEFLETCGAGSIHLSSVEICCFRRRLETLDWV